MSDEHRTREREHWQAIAEQLGLAPEGATSSAAPPPERKTEFRLEKQRSPEPEKTQAAWPEEEAVEPDVAPKGSTFWPPEFKPTFAAEKEQRSQAPPPRPGEAGATEDFAEDDSGRRPRRRGRGRRKERGEPGAPVPEGEALAPEVSRPDEPASEQSAEESSRRGRGRARPRKAKTSNLPADTEKESVGQESAEGDDADEMSDFADWSVPSWNDLIAALYRPGR